MPARFLARPSDEKKVRELVGVTRVTDAVARRLGYEDARELYESVWQIHQMLEEDDRAEREAARRERRRERERRSRDAKKNFRQLAQLADVPSPAYVPTREQAIKMLPRRQAIQYLRQERKTTRRAAKTEAERKRAWLMNPVDSAFNDAYQVFGLPFDPLDIPDPEFRDEVRDFINQEILSGDNPPPTLKKADIDRFIQSQSTSMLTMYKNFQARGSFKVFVSSTWYTYKREKVRRSENVSSETVYVLGVFPTAHKAEIITSKADLLEYFRTAIMTPFAFLSGIGYSGPVTIRSITFSVAKYRPARGGTYKPLPAPIANKKAIVNVKNKDNLCFVWSVLASLHPADKDAERVSKYKEFITELKFDEAKMPMSLDHIPDFESANDLRINVLQCDIDDESRAVPLFTSKSNSDRVVNLFLHEGHYSLVKNLDRLTTKDHYSCPRCLLTYTRKDALAKHVANCKFLESSPQGVLEVMPTGKDGKKPMVLFAGHAKMNEMPVVIYWDTESRMSHELVHDRLMNGAAMKTKNAVAKHVCASACMRIVSIIPLPEDVHTTYLFRGDDAMTSFVKTLVDIQPRLQKAIEQACEQHLHFKWTDEARVALKSAKECYMCKQPFGSEGTQRPVVDHCHFTGRFRGIAHRDCNFKAFVKPAQVNIPIIAHNQNYDIHQMLDKLTLFTDKENISCIPENMEKFKCLTVGRYKFIDSFAFMSASLEKLLDNLPAESKKTLKSLCATDEQFSAVQGKGYFPYDWFQSIEQFDGPVPAMEAFNNKMRQYTMKPDEYAEIQQVCELFNIQTFGEFHDHYLYRDVFGLADVFEEFRRVTMASYGLDPCYYTGAPALSWDAMLKYTGVQLELFEDVEMYRFCERGIRGGISVVSKRHVKANNKHLPDYNAEEPSQYLLYVDANNLYGLAMEKPLPLSGFKWMSDDELHSVLQNEDNDVGAILEVDLEYPTHLHDAHNDYPLAPERKLVEDCWMSEYTKQRRDKKALSVPKLLGTLHDKHNYVLNLETLRFYLKHGLVLKKVHRGIAFKQSEWLRPYIEYNSHKRAAAKNDFEKDFYKLMNNSCFGKTMENVRDRSSVKFANSEERFLKLAAMPNWKRSMIIREDLVLMDMKQTTVQLNKPIYAGLSILDFSKIHMFSFYYDVMQPKYGNNMSLVLTDTDSLVLAIKTEDLVEDLKTVKEHMDFSEYAKEHPLHDVTNKKVVGKFKDECGGVQMTEIIALKSKCYAYTKENGKGDKRLKGIPKVVVKNEISVDDYRNVLKNDEVLFKNCTNIRSIGQTNYAMKMNKKALTSYDDKRFILPNGIDTLAYGHYQLR